MSNCNSTGGADLVFIFSCSALALLINFCMKSISCCWSDSRVSVPPSIFPLVLGLAERSGGCCVVRACASLAPPALCLRARTLSVSPAARLWTASSPFFSTYGLQQAGGHWTLQVSHKKNEALLVVIMSSYHISSRLFPLLQSRNPLSTRRKIKC